MIDEIGNTGHDCVWKGLEYQFIAFKVYSVGPS